MWPLHGYSGRTNTQSNTAFRGFGGPQGALAIEYLIDSIGGAPANFYGTTTHNVTPYGQVVDDNILHELVDELAASSDYAARRAAIAAFNATSPVLKKGLALTPLKFGISFNVVHLQPGRRAGACLHRRQRAGEPRRHRDGPGPEHQGGAGGGARTGPAAGGRARDGHRHQKVANTSATAASTGSDLNGKAAQDAARQIRERLAAFAAEQLGRERRTRCALPAGQVSVGGQAIPSPRWSTWPTRRACSCGATASTPRPA
jgi:xanthine dehydrogenase large subunit